MISNQSWYQVLRAFSGLLIAMLILTAAYAFDRYQDRRDQPSEIAAQHRRSPNEESPLNFQLLDESKSAGVDGMPAHAEGAEEQSGYYGEALRRLKGAAVAVADVNSDGRPDIFVTYSLFKDESANRLFINQGGGRFEDATEKSGLAGLRGRGLFLDLTNSGRRDLVLLQNCPAVYRNDGKGVFKRDESVDLGCHCAIFGANVLDINDDGYIDLLLSPYAAKCNESPNNRAQATNGGLPIFFENQKGLTFKRVERPGLPVRPGWTHAIGVADIDYSGRSDIWFATDYGSDRIFLNDGKHGYTDVTSENTDHTYQGNGMSAEMADIDNDGRPVVFVSHVFQRYYNVEGNALWKWQAGHQFSEISSERGVNRCGFAWGAKFADVDNDGWQDLVVGNGFRSANRERNYYFANGTVDSGAQYMLRQSRMWPSMRDLSWSGYQSPCLFMNQSGKFVDMAKFTDFSYNFSSDNRGVATIDVENDGRLGFVFSNQSQPAELYRNRPIGKSPPPAWIGFELIGSRANRDALGAKVEVRLNDGRVLRREIQPFNGYMAQSDGRVHFGLGHAPKISSVVITWPGPRFGEQKLSGFELGTYNKVVEQ